MAGSLTAVADLAGYYEPYAWFALTWTIPLVVLCAAGLAFVNAERSPLAAVVASRAGGSRPRPLSLAVAATALFVFVIIYSYLIPYREDLVGLDYSPVTAGRFVAVPIWPATGRFFPLALQEYNLLALIQRSAVVYHAFSILELFVVLICCMRILDDVPGWLRCCAMLFMLVLPSFVVAFFGIVYPERDIIVWLGLWMVCLRSFDRTRSRFAFCGAIIAAQCVVYYKEPAFVIIGGFAGARLAIEAVQRREMLRRREYARFASEHLLEIAHLIIAAIFVVVYWLVVARHVTNTYAVAAGLPNAVRNALASYARSDWLLDALAAVLIGRLVYSIARRRPLDPLWEPLAIAALAYAMAFVKLGLTRDYYVGPADFVGVLYLTRLAFIGLSGQPRRVAVLAGVAIAFAFQRNVSSAATRLANRKEYVQGVVRFTTFLRAYASSHGRTAVQLYFPNVGGFELMELSSYLQFKGFDAGLAPSPSSASRTAFVMKTAHRYPDDRCLPPEPFRCIYAPAPQPGDLVVYLAGRELSARTLDSLNTASYEVFHYRPRRSRLVRVLSALAARDETADANRDVRVFESREPNVAISGGGGDRYGR